MTTKHSSLHLAPPKMLLDSISQPVHLGQQIGRGGEGAIFDVEGKPTYVAKVYHKRPLPEDQVAKLQTMISCWSNALETISSWPRTMLYDASSRKPCGILINKLVGAHQLHELYGTTNRRKHFPEVGWHHLILAARNTAAAFHTMHNSGIVVGDVNQGNLLVDKQMCVRMIDCDSFQIINGEKTFHCPVGTPHFTPPELQSLKLRDVARTQNHDRFGLAILIFHLLFVGRHPFAGRFHGPGDMSIERAIAERRFAFSRNRSETLVDPPPASLVLDDLPSGIGMLFEKAFRNAEGEERPTPTEWITQLDVLIKRRKVCKFDQTHVYALDAAECPWCRIEDAGGPAFFVPAAGSTGITADRLAVLEEKILEFEEAEFPDLEPEKLSLPAMPTDPLSGERMKRGWTDVAVWLLILSWAGAVAGAALGGAYKEELFFGAAIVSLVIAAALIIGRQPRSRRKVLNELRQRLSTMRDALWERGQRITAAYHKRLEQFQRATGDLKTELQNYRTADDNLQTVLVRYRELQRADYLRQYLIRDYFRKISGLTPSQVIMLEAYGVESANEVERIRLYGIPSIDPETVMELLQWRTEIEREFTFKPEHGITLADVGASKEVAVRRFKISQARKILTASRQLDSLADVGRDELKQARAHFGREADAWKKVAKELRAYQGSRRLLERLINRSPAFIAGLAVVMPLVALLAYLIFR